jgi:hypothetical protein
MSKRHPLGRTCGDVTPIVLLVVTAAWLATMADRLRGGLARAVDDGCEGCWDAACTDCEMRIR